MNPTAHQRIYAEIQERHEKKLEILRAERLELVEKALNQSAAFERLKEENQKLREALQWYVDTDEVDGRDGNEFWQDGKDRAIIVLEETK